MLLRRPKKESAIPEIVVGVDSSEASKAALRWAADEARLRGDVVVAILAWMPAVVSAGPWPAAVDVSDVDVQKDAKDHLARTIEKVLGHIPPVEIEKRVVHGPAAQVLLDAARHAQLLVVGSRGLGGFMGAVLGSVSQQCAQHAPCPVVIVRDTHNDVGP